MQIYGPFRVSTTHSASNIQRASASEKPAQSASAADNGPVDQLDLSQTASTSRVNGDSPIAGEGIRFERVAEIRRQIADGSYDTPERLEAALDRFLDLRG